MQLSASAPGIARRGQQPLLRMRRTVIRAPLSPPPLLRGLRHPTRPQVSCASRRRRDDFDDDASWGRSRRQRDPFRVRINGREVSVPEDALLRAALPAAVLLSGALFMGPIMIVAAAGALAMGAAIATAGVAMTALFFPFLMVAGIGGAFAFGTFATLGAVFVLPKLLVTLAVAGVGGGLLLGWGGINALMSIAGGQQEPDGRRGDAAWYKSDGMRGGSGSGSEDDEDDDAQRQVERELRMFDEQLRRRSRQR